MVKNFDEGDKMRRWKVRLKDPGDALAQIGAMMVAESQRSFKTQRFGKHQWRARGAINTFGIIADFASGKKTPPQRRFQKRPALRDTGTLSKSITWVVTGNAVQVGSQLEYADIHFTGGTSKSKPITKQVQAGLWAWLKGRGKKYKRKLGWLLNKKFTGETLETEVPERPFVGLTKTSQKNIEQIVGAHIMEIK